MGRHGLAIFIVEVVYFLTVSWEHWCWMCDFHCLAFYVIRKWACNVRCSIIPSTHRIKDVWRCEAYFQVLFFRIYFHLLLYPTHQTYLRPVHGIMVVSIGCKGQYWRMYIFHNVLNFCNKQPFINWSFAVNWLRVPPRGCTFLKWSIKTVTEASYVCKFSIIM